MRNPTIGLTHAAEMRRSGWSLACLLAVALAAQAPAPAAAAERYVALGDSYSSGTGTRDYRLDPALRAWGPCVCSRNEWLNGLSNPTTDSYHPNRDGHASGYAPLVLGTMAQPPPPPPPPVSDRLSDDARLAAGSDQSLRSLDGRYRFVMQHDGNLVLYGQPIRSTRTAGRPRWFSASCGRRRV